MATPTIYATCGHCGAEKVILNIIYAYDIEQPIAGALAKCPGCKKPSSLVLYSTINARSTDLMQTEGDLLQCHWDVISISPENRPPDVPKYLPETVGKFFYQAISAARRNDMPDTAVIMCRRTLEAAIQDHGETNGWLATRIKNLADKGKITPSLADWAHHIRELGNEAAHDLAPLPEGKDGLSRARSLVEFTRLVLMYLYTLPGMVGEAKAKAASSE